MKRLLCISAIACLLSGCVNIRVDANPDGSWSARGWSFWKEIELPTLKVQAGDKTTIVAEGWKSTNEASKAAIEKLATIAAQGL